MGIVLPAEVSEAATLALHHHWPEVDEDTLTGAAEAYRYTVQALASAAGDADRHTQQVVAVSTGGLARGLRRAADRPCGAEDSTVTSTATHCGLLADGLATDAGAVRQTKVAIASEPSPASSAH